MTYIERVIAMIADKAPLSDTGFGYGYVCVYCVSRRGCAEHPDKLQHKDACPWKLLVEHAEAIGVLPELRLEKQQAQQAREDAKRAEIEKLERAEFERLEKKFRR